MTYLKTAAFSLFMVTSFASATCVAQNVSELGVGAPLPPATHVQRCEYFGSFVKKAAIARDAGESEQHFAGHSGLHTPRPLVLSVTHAVFASNESPNVLQKKTISQCDRNNQETRGTYGYWRR